jgi:hypothetical protein
MPGRISSAASSLFGKQWHAHATEDISLRAAHFLLLLLLISTFAVAEGQPGGNAKPEAELAPNSAEPVSASAPVAPSAALQVALPSSPQPHKRVMDKKFIAVMGALGAAETTRFTSRTLMLEHEMAEGAPWVTSLPPHSTFVAKTAGIFAAEMFVTYELKKPHDWLPGDRVIRRLWWAYPVAMAAIHFRNAVSIIRTQPPAGCDAPECQGQ